MPSGPLTCLWIVNRTSNRSVELETIDQQQIMGDLSYSSVLARSLLDHCNALISSRTRFTSKEEFALTVLQEIFDNPSLDLMLLKPRPVDLLHADALNRLNALVGFESTLFTTIYTNDTLFNEFVDVFCRHCIRSTANGQEAMESLFIWLLFQYLQYLLPVDEQKLNQLKNSNWLSGPLASTMPTSAMTSPRRLLRPEVLAASSPLEHISLRSGSFRTLYPRLLQFVGNLLDHLASLSYWPSVAQFQVLKCVLNHYYEFLLCETEDSEFGSLKLLLLRKPLFTDLLHNFLDRLFKNWPLGDSYCILIEIWQVLVSPRAVHSSNLSEEKFRLFLEASTFPFLGLLEVQVRRLLDSNCAQILETPVLDFLKDNVFRNEPLLQLLDQQEHPELPIVNYLRALLATLCTCHDEIGAKLKKHRSIQERSWLMRLLNWLFVAGYQPPVNMHELERQINELRELIDWLIGRRGRSTSNWQQQSGGTSFMSQSQSPAWSHSILRPEIPDNKTDPWTKMLFLTPHGRMQVINRQAKFDYAPYAKQISDTFPSIGSWDIAPLARLLHRVSIKWTNSWLVRYLRQRGHDSVLTRLAAKALLSGPSPPRYVPVFARMVPKHEARLNLHVFANLPTLIYILLACLIFFTIFYNLF